MNTPPTPQENMRDYEDHAARRSAEMDRFYSRARVTVVVAIVSLFLVVAALLITWWPQ